MAEVREATGRAGLATLLLVCSVAILVGTEVFGVAVATAWALGGLLELGSTMTYVIGALLVGLGFYVMVPFVRRAWRLEATGSDGDAAPGATSDRNSTVEQGDGAGR